MLPHFGHAAIENHEGTGRDTNENKQVGGSGVRPIQTQSNQIKVNQAKNRKCATERASLGIRRPTRAKRSKLTNELNSKNADHIVQKSIMNC